METMIRFMARPGFMAREVAGEQILIPLDTGGVRLSNEEHLPSFNGMIRLNGLGLFLWQELKDPRTIDELAAAVEARFDTKGQNIREDIRDFLNTGIQNQLIFMVQGKE